MAGIRMGGWVRVSTAGPAVGLSYIFPKHPAGKEKRMLADAGHPWVLGWVVAQVRPRQCGCS